MTFPVNQTSNSQEPRLIESFCSNCVLYHNFIRFFLHTTFLWRTIPNGDIVAYFSPLWTFEVSRPSISIPYVID